MGAFRLLGFVVHKGQIQAFLGHEQHIYLITQGELIEGRFQVTSLDPSALTLHDTHTGVQTTFVFKER